MRLDGRVALVVGAGSIGAGWGNGKAAAALFAREGARVFCVDRNTAAAEETAAIISGDGGQAIPYTADISSRSDIRAMVSACFDAYGRIDVLNNNVGIFEPGNVVDLAEDAWDRAFSVNLKAVYLTMKQVIPDMVRQGGGSIINISSVSSIRHLGISGVTYGSSKAALNHMTRLTAVEFARHGVRVNAILPGLMRTPFVELSVASRMDAATAEARLRERDERVPMGRMGDAWDVAKAALFLASDDSRYITGTELVVDGGLSC